MHVKRKSVKRTEYSSHMMPIAYFHRVYTDLFDSEPMAQVLCDLTCSDPDVDICHVDDIPAFGDIQKMFPMIWRFMPMLDHQVGDFFSNSVRKN